MTLIAVDHSGNYAPIVCTVSPAKAGVHDRAPKLIVFRQPPPPAPAAPAQAGVHLQATAVSARTWTPAFAEEAGSRRDVGKQNPITSAGFTLIEVIIALALFALIALAGVTLLGSVLRVQRGTQGRLERLADEQRAMFVLAGDFGSMANAPLTATRTGVEFARRTPAGPRALRYALSDGVLQRALDHGAQVQALLGGVGALHWQYYVRDKGWSERWPPSPEQAQVWPAAIAADLELTGTPGTPPRRLRRVVVLPLRPALPPPRLVLPGRAGVLPGQQLPPTPVIG